MYLLYLKLFQHSGQFFTFVIYLLIPVVPGARGEANYCQSAIDVCSCFYEGIPDIHMEKKVVTFTASVQRLNHLC